MEVIILSGVSGSGKSTYADKLLQRTGGLKVSADHYFMREGVYTFDPSKLGAAHADCFRRFIDCVSTPPALRAALVMVDNTNTEVYEIAAYYMGALAFGYNVEIRTIDAHVEDIDSLVSRNVHNVHRDVIIAQGRRLATRKLPAHWKHSYIQFV